MDQVRALEHIPMHIRVRIRMGTQVRLLVRALCQELDRCLVVVRVDQCLGLGLCLEDRNRHRGNGQHLVQVVPLAQAHLEAVGRMQAHMGRLELVELLEVLGKKHGKKPRRSKKRTELGKPRRNGKKSWRRDFEKLEKRKLEKEKPEKPKREKKMPGKRGKRQRRR